MSVHKLQKVNKKLAEGRFFFLDVVKDGIALYQSDDSDLATPKPTRPAEAPKLAREYYEEWFPSAGAFFDGYLRSEEHTSELQSLLRISYAVLRLNNTHSSYTTRSHTKVHKTIAL